MPEKCAYPPCKCKETREGGVCGEFCEAFGTEGFLSNVEVDSDAEHIEPNDPARLKCGCGHQGCAEYH